MKVNKLFFLGITSILFVFCTHAQNFKSLDKKQFSAVIKKTTKPQIVDVRTPGEYKAGHLKNAVNVNYRDASFEVKMLEFDKNKPIFVYCQAGGRSKKSAEKLAEMGFTQIYELDKGYTEWVSQ